jgi:cytochrome c-type protein NapC
MNDNVYQEYKETPHFRNPTGVRATCPDCHVPKEWLHKVVRKVKATNELYHWAIGSIDTREKFLNKRSPLATHVWETMQKTDSRECRNCHSIEAMALGSQSLKGGKVHELSIGWGMTCIQCHQGIAHKLPESFDKQAVIDGWHKLIEQQKVACNECHEDMPAPPSKEEW